MLEILKICQFFLVTFENIDRIVAIWRCDMWCGIVDIYIRMIAWNCKLAIVVGVEGSLVMGNWIRFQQSTGCLIMSPVVLKNVQGGDRCQTRKERRMSCGCVRGKGLETPCTYQKAIMNTSITISV